MRAHRRQAEFADQLQELVVKKLSRRTLVGFAADTHLSPRTVAKIRDGLHKSELLRALRSKRKRAGWVSIVARLAGSFGRPAKEWVEAAGFRWEEVASLVERGSKESGETARRTRFDGGVLDDITARHAAGDPYPVKVAVIPYDPFSTNLGSGSSTMGHDLSFNAIYADRLVGSIDREWQIDLNESTDIPNLIAAILANEIHMAVGMWATSARHRKGIRFIDIPGWRIPLSGLCVLRRGRTEVPSWRDLLNPLARQQCRVVAVDGPETDYLIGTLRYSREQIVTCSEYSVIKLAALFRKTAAEWPSSPVVLVSDEHTCREVLHRVQDLGERITPLGDGSEVYPKYPLSIAVKDDSKWIDLIQSAQNRELFGLSSPMMARLYAAVLAQAINSMQKIDVAEIHESWKLHNDWGNRGEWFRDEIAHYLRDWFGLANKGENERRDLTQVFEALLPNWTSNEPSADGVNR